MTEPDVTIKTPDGTADCHFVHPAKGAHAAVLPAEIEVYAGAAHGWCPPDSQVYNEKQAERAWSRLLVLFGKALA